MVVALTSASEPLARTGLVSCSPFLLRLASVQENDVHEDAEGKISYLETSHCYVVSVDYEEHLPASLL